MGRVSQTRWLSWQEAEYRRYGACVRCGALGHHRGARAGRVYCLAHIPLRRKVAA